MFGTLTLSFYILILKFIPGFPCIQVPVQQPLGGFLQLSWGMSHPSLQTSWSPRCTSNQRPRGAEAAGLCPTHKKNQGIVPLQLSCIE